ncbi:hypothetical protein NL676_036914 [Syzygium grande]|nr:hypothetical protein NL676_036914 [Syzygium grande]
MGSIARSEEFGTLNPSHLAETTRQHCCCYRTCPNAYCGNENLSTPVAWTRQKSRYLACLIFTVRKTRARGLLSNYSPPMTLISRVPAKSHRDYLQQATEKLKYRIEHKEEIDPANNEVTAPPWGLPLFNGWRASILSGPRRRPTVPATPRDPGPAAAAPAPSPSSSRQPNGRPEAAGGRTPAAWSVFHADEDDQLKPVARRNGEAADRIKPAEDDLTTNDNSRRLSAHDAGVTRICVIGWSESLRLSA